MLGGYYFFNLPDSTADALGFEEGAWNMSRNGFFGVFKYFSGPGSYFYSWVLSLIHI